MSALPSICSRVRPASRPLTQREASSRIGKSSRHSRVTCQLSASIAMPTTTTRDRAGHGGRQRRGERPLRADHVVVEPGDERAGLGAGEERQRLTLHVAEDLGAQVEDQALTDARGVPATDRPRARLRPRPPVPCPARARSRARCPCRRCRRRRAAARAAASTTTRQASTTVMARKTAIRPRCGRAKPSTRRTVPRSMRPWSTLRSVRMCRHAGPIPELNDMCRPSAPGANASSRWVVPYARLTRSA